MLQLSAPHTLVVQAQVQRYAAVAADACEPRFRAMLAPHFFMAQVPTDALHPDFAGGACTLHVMWRRPAGVAPSRAQPHAEGAPRAEGGASRVHKRRRAEDSA